MEGKNGNTEVSMIPDRRWSDRPHRAMAGTERGLRETLLALSRRKWIILSAFVVTAIALGTAYALGVSREAVCLIAVKKPSQMFVPAGQTGSLSSASVPLLEGQTYKDMVESVAFATTVAAGLTQDSLQLNPAEVGARLRAEFREPDLLRLRAQDREPSRAILIANAACQALADLNQKELRAELEASMVSITKLRGEASKEVESAQAKLATYMQQEGLANVDNSSSSSELSRALEVVAGYEMVLAKEEAALQAAQERLKELQSGAAASMEFPTVEDPAIRTLRTQVEAVRVKLWDSQKQFTDAHPVVKNIRTQLMDLQRELDDHLQEAKVPQGFHPSAEHKLAIREKIAETNQEILTRKAQIAAWSRLIQGQRRTLSDAPRQRAELEQLKLSLAFAEDRYRTLSRRLDETAISLGATRGTISVIQLAVGPEPRNNRSQILMAVVLLLGFPLGVGLLVDYMGNKVQSPAAFGRQVGLTCLATVPKTHGLRLAHSLTNGSVNGSGRYLESFQILRSGIHLASGVQRLRRIAVVGCKSGEGRSTLVLNLAHALAEEQKRVVIVDVNLRSPSLPRMLGVESDGGLVEVLTGEQKLGQVLHRTTQFNAILLPAMAAERVLPHNAALLFRTPQFAQTLNELNQFGDIVLFDTSPLLEFADTLELLPHIDGVIFVTEAVNGAEDDVQRSLDLLRASGVRNLGMVLNKVK